MNNQVKNNDSDSKKIFTILIMIFTLMVCTTGATYAYFAITTVTNTAMTGTAATVDVILTNNTTNNNISVPELIAPSISTYKTKPLIPQYSYRNSTNVLQKALTGAGVDKCVDGNGNVICRAYTFVIKNIGNTNVNVRGKLKFNYSEGAVFTNLRWKLMDDADTVSLSNGTVADTFSSTSPIKSSTSYVTLDESNVNLSANGGSKQYWMIFWIEEAAVNQNEIDKGTFNAEIAFDIYDDEGNVMSGITSTITS